jgi:hypothetical protein
MAVTKYVRIVYVLYDYQFLPYKETGCIFLLHILEKSMGSSVLTRLLLSEASTLPLASAYPFRPLASACPVSDRFADLSRMAGTRFMFAALMAILLLVVRSEYRTPKTLKQSSTFQYLKAIPFGSVLASSLFLKAAAAETKGKLEYQPALQGLDYGKPRTYYPDYAQKPSGLQYKAVTEGTGLTPKKGDRVVVDWEGYTIGYYGRPFQTRNKVKGGAFDSTEKEYFRWVLGSGSVVAALDEAVQYMKEVQNEMIPFFIYILAGSNMYLCAPAFGF